MNKIDVKNPYNLEVVDQICCQSEAEVMAAVDEAQIIVQKQSWIPKLERIQILEKFKNILIRDQKKLITQAIKEGGKPYQDSVVEIHRGINGVEIAIEELKALSGKEIPMGISASSQNRRAYTFYRPRGVVVAISAFNHPFNLIIHQVIPAIAAGCPVIVKPASTTPLSCRSIIEALYEAGLDKKYAKMAICSNDVATKLVAHSANSFLTFIGSGRVGWFLRSQLPEGANCALEHGGSAPVIVDESADLTKCVPALVKGGYYHAGQVCVSVQRVFVHKKISNEFLSELTAHIKKLNTGDPLLEETQVGPLITPQEVERVEDWVAEATKLGAKSLIGGQKKENTLFEPTLLLDVPEASTLAKNEIFGPVVCVESFENFEDAISKANHSKYAFQSSIFTQDIDKAMWTTQKLESLAVMVNDHTAFRTDWMPFGGYKSSGLGVGGIGHSLKDMSVEKLVVIQSSHL